MEEPVKQFEHAKARARTLAGRRRSVWMCLAAMLTAFAAAAAPDTNELVRTVQSALAPALDGLNNSRRMLEAAALSLKVRVALGEMTARDMETQLSKAKESLLAQPPTPEMCEGAGLELQWQVRRYLDRVREGVKACTQWPEGHSEGYYRALCDEYLMGIGEEAPSASRDPAEMEESLCELARIKAWTAGAADTAAEESRFAGTAESIDRGLIDAFQEQVRTAKPPAGGPSVAGAAPQPPPAAGSSTGGTTSGADTGSGTRPPAAPTTPASGGTPPSAGTTMPLPPEPAVPAPPAPEPPRVPSLILETASLKSGEKIVVTHSDVPVRNVNAWIGFYKVSASDKDYLCYSFLRNLTKRVYDVKAPDEAGTYNFRLFLDEGYTPAAVSGAVEVK
jgi:hypothetical protein